MAVLPIRISGDPVLHEPALPVGEIDESLRALVADMFDTMEAAPGVGLAGPQVGVPLRLFVFNWVDADDTLWRGTAINPELWITPTPAGEPDEET
jgi:peptide deformylase